MGFSWKTYRRTYPKGYSGFGRAVAGCITYLFSSLTTDSLQLGSPFTGNIKAILAATSSDGIPNQIMAGMQGGGGGPVTNTWKLNGTSFGKMPGNLLIPAGGTVSLEIRRTPYTEVQYILHRDSANTTRLPALYLVLIQNTLAWPTEDMFVKWDGNYISSNTTIIPSDGEWCTLEIIARRELELGYVGIYQKGDRNPYKGSIRNLKGDTTSTVSGTFNFPLDEPYSDPYSPVDVDTGLVMTTENVISTDIIADGVAPVFPVSTDPLYAPVWVQFDADVASLESIVDSDFNGVVGGYAKDGIWYDVHMGPDVPPVINADNDIIADVQTAEWVSDTPCPPA